MKLIPKNWSSFQQYKDRKPLWIKFHRDLLNDFSYSSVQIGTKATLPLLWLLACEYEDGIIDASIEEISFRIHIDKKIVKSAIEELIECKFFTLVQECTELYENVPREEKRRDREETEKKTEIVTTQSYDDSLRIANYLLNNIIRVNSSFSKPNLDAWAKDIDKAIRIDGRTVQQLKECIDWIYSEPKGFWIPNIMSGKKLREKFDTMNMQMKRPTKQNRTDNNINVAQSWLEEQENNTHDVQVIGG